MRLPKTTPDGNFTVTIRCAFTDQDDVVPDESLQ